MDLTVLSTQLGKYLDMPTDLPPVECWTPELSGDIDMLIKSDGTWLHEGDKIEREKLVRLFSTILKREGDDYFLVTPIEKWRLNVEDQPFIVVLMQILEINGNQVIRMMTNTGDEVELNTLHPLIIDNHEAPKILIRNCMHARLNRNVYYQLAELATEKNGDYFIESKGEVFQIG